MKADGQLMVLSYFNNAIVKSYITIPCYLTRYGPWIESPLFRHRWKVPRPDKVPIKFDTFAVSDAR